MLTEILFQIVLVTTIVALIMLIFVFGLLITVLNNLRDSTKIARKRIREADQLITRMEEAVNSFVDMAKGFTASVTGFNTIKNKIGTFFSESKEEHEQK